MSKGGDIVKKRSGILYALFQKIAEPRTRRLIYFAIYIGLIIIGSLLAWRQPSSFENLIGPVLVWIFGGFIASGATIGLVAVLPGIWWLERAGLVLICSGLVMYMVIALYLGVSLVGMIISVLFVLFLVLRWMEIKDKPLAPKKE